MKIEKINKKLIKVIVDKDDYNLDEYNNNVQFLESKKILTFGDTNVKIFKKYFEGNGYNPEILDLCLDDDKSIGLEMPNTWYLNRGSNALSIATYYNYLNWHSVIEHNNLKTFNEKIVSDYGRISCVEIYVEKELRSFLELHKIEYFGTPRTLTECIRYLEGWSNTTRYARLKDYAVFSKFIELWSSINFPSLNLQEWYLGKEKSINEMNRVTNVRQAVKYFWQNYLLKKEEKISDEDIEIDILSEKFHTIRQPKIILLSEDLFSEKNSNTEIFKNLTKDLSKEKMYVSKLKNDFPMKNAEAAKEIYPDSLIVLIENDTSFNRNFSLVNPVKHGINTEIVITTKILRHIIETYYGE
ncbi:MAG: hypothetical protein AAB510_03525 [Patescibacteria group bacterium]